jgi:hypothetical protein
VWVPRIVTLSLVSLVCQTREMFIFSSISCASTSLSSNSPICHSCHSPKSVLVVLWTGSIMGSWNLIVLVFIIISMHVYFYFDWWW